MKTEFLKALGISEEQIKAIMAENGKDIQAEKEKTRDAEEKVRAANDALTALKAESENLKAIDAEGMKNEILRLKAEIQSRDEAKALEAKELKMKERFEKAVGDKKFANSITRNGIFEAFKAEAEKDGAKPDDVIFSAVTKDLDGIFASENPVVDIPAVNGDCGKIDESEVRSVMGLPFI